MGIIVADELDLMGNGVTVPNCYINIDRILIKKSNIPDFIYEINADKQIFVNKLMRTEQNRNVIVTERVSTTSNVITNVEDQLYTAMKTEYTSYTDDL
jgi:hypothetical protein|tara:strand:+ start:259 stop:552 length:294 start_codon:yes stop_codon:yes gene_type:complete